MYKRPRNHEDQKNQETTQTIDYQEATKTTQPKDYQEATKATEAKETIEHQ